ncbi:MAG: hypothetical protein QOE82_3302 [Thermoanaerobaculia bacterium]|jgi:phenylacetate-CoA ligase|nr:hypothetical protein [Thermoanaerobaculia bacterium]
MTFLRSYLGARWRFRRLRGDAVQRYQDERAREIVAFAMAHSPFYRAHFAGHDPREWQSLPTIDKAAMMRNFDTFNTRGVSLDEAMAVALRAERDRDFSPTIRELTVGLSSGTSGHRGLFLVDRSEQLMWAGTMFARALPRLRMRGLRLAFFLRSNSNLYQTLGRWIDFRYFDLMTPIDVAVAELNAFQPHLLVAPPSLLAMLTNARIRPERVISVAEVLEPQDEVRLRKAFGADVHQVYQCTEGLLAVSCARGSLHVQEDLVAIQFERAGDDSQPLTPIVTDLRRRVQPILRYRLNDAVTLSPDPCPCGSAFRVIERIEGRCDDICYFVRPDGALRAFFPDALRRMVLLSDPRIEDYRIVQDAPGELRVQLAVEGGFEEVALSLHDSIARSIASYGCLVPSLEIVRGIPDRAPSEKRRRVFGPRRPQSPLL